MKTLRSQFIFLVLICSVAAIITRYIWSTRAWIETHDGIFHVIRTVQMSKVVRGGEIPARWAGDLDNGFGLPLFTYVYPGPYITALPLMLAGIGAKWAVKLVTCLFFLAGGLGIYALFANKKKSFAVAASLLYLTAPYFLVNIFVRGALGETMAMALLPWVLVSLQNLSTTGKLRWYHPIPYAVLFLAHNFLSFVFLPVFIGAAYIYRCRPMHAVKSLMLSLGLAAFFVIPMLGERGYIASFANGNFTYPYSDHFVYPMQLIYSKWGNGPSLPGTGDGMSFQLGYALIAMAVIGVGTAVVKRQRSLVTWSVLLAGTIFLMLPYSDFVWRIISPLQAMQFPWRFLSFTPLLILCLVGEILHDKYKGWVVWLGVIVSFVLALQYSKPPYLQNNEQFDAQIFIHGEKTTTSSRQELLPRWVTGVEKWKGNEDVRAIGGAASFSVTHISPRGLTIESQSVDSGVQYQVRRNYFPSWGVRDEKGKKIPVAPSADGEILFTPDTGTHTYTVAVGQTVLEKIANAITVLTGLYILIRRKKEL